MIGGLKKAARYRAVSERDKKYDGIFYFAVEATGLYCRPSCPFARPLLKNYLFFDTITDALAHHYRACSHCHPGRLKDGLSIEILSNIDAGGVSEKGVHGLADSMHISERHLRRIVQARTGISPTGLNNAKRLGAARLLVAESTLPIIDIAFRTDFASLRRFNDAFKTAFKISPREMRKAALLAPLPKTLTKRKVTHEKN